MIDCNGCKHKHTAGSENFCEEFHLSPQLDSCEMHSVKVEARKVVKPQIASGEYLWLDEVRLSSTLTQGA